MRQPLYNLLIILFWAYALPMNVLWAQEQLEQVQVEAEREKSGDATSSGHIKEVRVNYPSASVADQLQDIPGLMWMRAGGEGRRSSLSIRGVSNQQIQVQWEGVPLNTALGGGTDLSQIPTWGDELLEVYQGGNGVLGSSAIGGAIHIRKRRTAVSPQSTELGIRAGGFGSLGGRAMYRNDLQGWTVQTGLEGTRRRGDFTFIDHNGNRRKRVHNASRDWSWTGSVDSPNINHHRFRVSSWIHGSERQMPGVEQFPTLDAFLEQKRWVNSIQWTLPGSAAVTSDLQWWVHQRSSRYTSTTSLLGSRMDNKLLSNSTGGQGNLRWFVTDWATAVFRVDSSLEQADIQLTEKRRNEFRSVLGSTQALEVSLWREELLLVPAIRTNWTSDQSFIALPKAGAQWRPFSWMVLSTNGSRAYRPPSFEELYFDQGSIKGNPDLNPEKAWSLDTGLKLGSNNYWARATMYALWIDNLILFLPTSAFLIQASDSKSARSLGVEGEAGIALNQHLQVRGGYTYTETRFNDTGEALPARSPHTAFGRFSWKEENALVSCDLRWRSAFPLDRFGQLREEGRLMIDASWKYELSPKLTLMAQAFNLLDKQDAVDAMLQPLPGRSFFAITSLEF